MKFIEETETVGRINIGICINRNSIIGIRIIIMIGTDKMIDILELQLGR